MEKKTLAVGTASFPAMILENRYYVDKTDVVKPLMESGKYVQLITRPRRFGTGRTHLKYRVNPNCRFI